MSVRTYVGFVADFPREHNGDDPPGQQLAGFVAERLKDAEFTVQSLSDREGWAWEFCTTQDDLTITSIVGLVDDMDAQPPRQWLITNDCETGLIKRLFVKKASTQRRDLFLRTCCDTLHQIMSADSRFSHVVWYNRETFDKPNDDPADRP